jgi:hypothetical protein
LIVHYSGCNQVCAVMMDILQEVETLDDLKLALDIHILVLLEVIKLISHADTSSGAAGDVVSNCLYAIEVRCKSAEEADHKHYFEKLIKAANNKAFKEWAEWGYGLLKATVNFIHDHKQEQKVYDTFAFLGPMYNGKEYPDKYLITLDIIDRLEGSAAAEQYLMDNINIPELRSIAVEKALSAKQYAHSEVWCLEALKNEDRHFGKAPKWAYYLERLYGETSNHQKRIEMVLLILYRGDTSYYAKLKELCQLQGDWSKRRVTVLHDLSAKLMSHDYASLLANEGEFELLLSVVQQYKYFIVHYGQLLSSYDANETYRIYEEYILTEAKAATDRGKYKAVCKSISNFSGAGAKAEALNLIGRLTEMYPRRPAMLDELEGLKTKLMKPSRVKT